MIVLDERRLKRCAVRQARGCKISVIVDVLHAILIVLHAILIVLYAILIVLYAIVWYLNCIVCYCMLS